MIAKVNETKHGIIPVIISFNNTGGLHKIKASVDWVAEPGYSEATRQPK